MASGIYTAMSAARTQEQRLESISANLANARTPGFKRHRAVYRQIQNDASKTGDSAQAMGMGHPLRYLPEDRLPVITDERFTEWSQGALKQTRNPLDVAIDGEGFFVVEGAGGQPAYTRNGAFRTEPSGAIVTQEGAAVLDDAGNAITVPMGEGQIVIHEDGRVDVGGEEVGRLQVVRFADNSKLERVGYTAFRPIDDSQPEPAGAVVRQGFVEQSNTNPVMAMTLLIKTNRMFELSTRAIQAYKAMDDSAVRDVSRTS